MTTNFQSRFTNYEFIRSVKSSGFTFTCYKEKIDWDRLAQVDLDKVVHELDISVLQEHVSTIVRCDLGELRGIDPGLVKLFRLSQLCLEYCIFCQEQLTISQEQLQQSHEKAIKGLEATHKELKIKKDDLKKEVRKRKKLNHQKENIINSSYQCTMCPKAFVSIVFLDSHMKRRHQDKEENVEVSKLKAELETLRSDLTKEKEASTVVVLAAKEAQVAREEALWIQMEKTQAEQRARHQAELTELTETFQTQLKNNLAKQQWLPSDTQALETQHQEQIKLLQLLLERKKEEEVEIARQQSEDAWKQRLESLEAWHVAERKKLQAQLDSQQAQEELRLAALEAEKQEAIAASVAAVATLSQSVPKPASRRIRSEHRAKSQDSPLLSHNKKASSDNPVTLAKKSPSRPSPPPPAPRKRLQRTEAEEEIVIEATSSPPSIPIAFSTTEPMPAARAVKKTSVVTKAKSAATLVPSSVPQVPCSSHVRPLISSDSDCVSEEAHQSVQEMKEALKQHPDILQSLKADVESHIDVKLSEFGIEGDTESLGQTEFSRITALLNHQRKVSKKKFQNYTSIRRDLDRIIEDRLIEHGVVEEKVLDEPNLKPSKMKQSGQAAGFLARLTHHYQRKSKKKEPKMFTSTPMKKAESATNDVPHSILKLSREQLWLGGNGSTSEPASPTKSDSAKPLERTQSLPAPKAVTFASEDQRTTSPSSSSWDHDLPDDEATSVIKATEKPKSAFETSAVVQQQGMTSASADAEHKTALSFLATTLPDQQPSTSTSGNFLKPAKNSANPQKSSTEKNDNSWDLEDL